MLATINIKDYRYSNCFNPRKHDLVILCDWGADVTDDHYDFLRESILQHIETQCRPDPNLHAIRARMQRSDGTVQSFRTDCGVWRAYVAESRRAGEARDVRVFVSIEPRPTTELAGSSLLV